MVIDLLAVMNLMAMKTTVIAMTMMTMTIIQREGEDRGSDDEEDDGGYDGR